MAVETHLGAPNCSCLCRSGWARQPLPTALLSRRTRAAQRVAAPCLLSCQGLCFLSRRRLSWSLVSPLSCPPRSGLGDPPWCSLYFCLQGTVVCGPAEPQPGRCLSVGRRANSCSPEPCTVSLFCTSRSPASSILGPGAQDWANYTPFTKRVLKLLVHEYTFVSAAFSQHFPKPSHRLRLSV